jgi:glutamate 5-kinase
MKFLYKKIVIKIGTNVLTQEDGTLDLKVMREIVEQIALLKKQGLDLIIVSSGAMGAGQALINLSKKSNDVSTRQVLAAIGQSRLMNIYSDFFAKHNFLCAQILATKSDFRDREHYLNMKNCFENLLQDRVIPIVNENDVVSVSELMFTDNDELAGLIASMMNFETVISLTCVDGIYDGDEVIPEINSKKFAKLEKIISPGKSKFGRGGMLTKAKIAKRLSSLGISTHIVNGKRKGVILELLQNNKIGTKFLAQKGISSTKRWLAASEGHEKGVVYVNKCAGEVLTSKNNIASLLPVGITKIEGDFEKGDIIKIKNDKKEDIAYGMAGYSSETARKYLGKQGKRELVHYDYLFVKS